MPNTYMSYNPYRTPVSVHVPGYGGNRVYGRPYRKSTATTLVTTRGRGGRKPSLQKAIARTLPQKQFSATNSVSLIHNTLYTYNMTAAITQGTTNATRIGDSINLAALKIKGMYYTNGSAGAYTARVLIGFSGEEYVAASFTGALGLDQLFLPNTGGVFTTNGIVNPKAFSVLYDQTIDLNSTLSGIVDVQSMAATISLNDQKFPYQSASSIYGKTKNLYMVVVACIGGGTTGLTATGDISIASDIIFR